MINNVLFNFDKVVWQGLNGPINANDSREQMIEHILSKQLEDGGFSLLGTNADPDMTAMAI